MKVIKLQYNVSINYKPQPRTVPHTVAYEFYVLETEKEDKMDFIERTIRKSGQSIIDAAISYSDSLIISTNEDIERTIKSQI